MTRPDHLFVSSTDGAMYDTRVAGWHQRQPLRALYSKHHKDITSAAEFKATLRAGGFAWPGGYPLYFVLEDGEFLSFAGAKSRIDEILYDMTHDIRGRGSWWVVGCDINWEHPELVCCETGKPIEFGVWGNTMIPKVRRWIVKYYLGKILLAEIEVETINRRFAKWMARERLRAKHLDRFLAADRETVTHG